MMKGKNVPLYCNVEVAIALNAEAGIAYEHLRWMIQDSKGKKAEFGTIHEDGRRWVDFTYAQLLEWLPIFRSAKSLRDTITKLEKAGLINSKPSEGGKFYTISDLDPATLTKIVTPDPDENRHDTCPISSDSPDENSQTPLTKNEPTPDENRHPSIYKDFESTFESTKTEPDTESFSSSPRPSESPVVKEKEEIENPLPSGENISILETERTVMKLAEIVGLNHKSARVRRDITEAIQDIRPLAPADLERYMEYYQSKQRAFPRPTIRFIVDGWTQYTDWLKSQLERIQGDTLPGTDVYLRLSLADWQMVKGLDAGESFTYFGTRGPVVFVKQPDGAFSAVETEAQVS